ncbi:MAG: sigma-70 family RNA polymerase sigma factor [Deltaproteobacteria bacterium]|nr:sigma-70 family RNA polymerase sigma factor [Deltaproteobacteria bacterium]
MADDLELLQAAKAGDRAALDELLARHEQQIYRFGLRMCGNESDARDILQETLTAAFRNLGDYRGEGALSTWLYQIARSFCIKSHRRRVGEPSHTLSLEGAAAQAVPTEASAPDERAQAHEMGQIIQAAMLALPDSAREVIILRDVEGLSASEAASVIGIDVPALKSRLHRARMELRSHLSALLDAPASAPACAALATELADYAASDIDQAACERIEAHLERCEQCRRSCDVLKRTVSLCRHIPAGEVPRPVRDAVVNALRDTIAKLPGL